MIGHGRWRAWHTHALPCMHELCRRLHFQEFALENIWLASCNAGRTPTAAFADVSGPFPRVENARPDPPVDDLVRSECSEYALGGAAISTVARISPSARFASAFAAPLLISVIFPP